MSKQITCPEHKTHQATLYVWPEKFAGVWECGDISDSCEHENTHTEVVEVDTMRNGEHDTYETTITVCDDCEVSIDD